MKKIELHSLGKASDPGPGAGWEDILEPGVERQVVEFLLPDSQPTEVQVRAIRDAKLLTSRRNLLVSSTTNSGKSLLGYLALLRGTARGRRVLLLEPLRAIAQEKRLELSALTKAVKEDLGREISVEISTGDYRLEHESMQSPPPADGELVVATPERIETILRNPDFDEWIKSISVVVVDEAHLLGDSIRGASLEYVITSLKLLAAPPRFILLSATLGETEQLENWLSPCDTVLSTLRTPTLHRSLMVLGEGDDLLVELQQIVAEILADPGTSVLIFVYQTAAADKLARDLKGVLGEAAGATGPRSYHSRQSAATREGVRKAFADGATRCVVSTTALGMGVNLPATHVILRDLARVPGGKVRADELIQMSGRAGRGSREGHAHLILKPKDPWTEAELIEALDSDSLPPIRSALIPMERASSFDGNQSLEPPLAESVLSLLARNPKQGLGLKELERFIGSTFAGPRALSGLQESLNWLAAPSRILAYGEEDQWKPTTLGQRAIQSSIPLSAAAGVAQLIRDLLSVDSGDAALKDVSKLDLLILCELVSTGTTSRIRYSDRLVEQVDAWMGRSSEKSVFFTKWIRGAEGFSKAEELLGSLGVSDTPPKGKAKRNPRREAYVATCRAILLWQRSQGVSAQDVMRRWDIKDLEEVEEKWRDNRLFMLGAMASLWEVRCFYFHLKEECGADDERIHRVKRALQRISTHTYQLLDLLAWCSPLGPLFVRMRRALSSKKGAVPARATLRRLEESGIKSIADLNAMKEDDFKKIGVRGDLSKTIRTYLGR